MTTPTPALSVAYIVYCKSIGMSDKKIAASLMDVIPGGCSAHMVNKLRKEYNLTYKSDEVNAARLAHRAEQLAVPKKKDELPVRAPCRCWKGWKKTAAEVAAIYGEQRYEDDPRACRREVQLHLAAPHVYNQTFGGVAEYGCRG